jgi:hypothetical protein
MGTRGFTGLVIDGVEKIGYQQYDSYPSGVGVQVLKELHELVKDMDRFKELAQELQVVSNSTPPTADQIERLAEFTDLGVSNQSTDDWYCVLRSTQGSIRETLRAGFVEDNHTFPLDSLFCEYGYLVDLDKGTFEVYEGFQHEIPKTGRWAGRPTAEEDAENYKAHVAWCAENGREPWNPEVSEYKAVKLLHVWELDNLPDEATFLAVCEENEDE